MLILPAECGQDDRFMQLIDLPFRKEKIQE
jgi:hypothetical protein